MEEPCLETCIGVCVSGVENYDCWDPKRFANETTDPESEILLAVFSLSYEYEHSGYFPIVRMTWFTPSPWFKYAVWYNINFYLTVVGFVFEFLLLLAMFSSMLKKKSELLSYYYLLNSIIILSDMIRLFIVADYRFVPSRYFSNEMSYTLRSVYIVYGFFMCIFVPVCQLTLTVNRLTAVIFPLKHRTIWSKRNSTIILIIVIAIPVILTIPYSLRQTVDPYRPLTSFLPISIGRYVKIIILIGISLASVSSATGMVIIMRFFLFRNQFTNVAFEIRLLMVVMISNVGCINYNICQLLSQKKYFELFDYYAIYAVNSGELLYAVYFLDQLSKSILILHHYLSFIILTFMSSAIRQTLIQFYRLNKIPFLKYFKKSSMMPERTDAIRTS